MKKELIIGLTLFVVVGSGVLYLNQTVVKNNKSTDTTKMVKQKDASTESRSGLVLANEVAQHNSAQDCWIIVEDKVYDLSNFANKHLGGIQVITNICGSDGTNVFNTRGDRGPHPASAKEKLSEFLVGELK
ncbi:MAG: cytochrome b5-like heme/steroid binding domain-containing protein [Patescibacteria group bacterium]